MCLTSFGSWSPGLAHSPVEVPMGEVATSFFILFILGCAYSAVPVVSQIRTRYLGVQVQVKLSMFTIVKFQDTNFFSK